MASRLQIKVITWAFVYVDDFIILLLDNEPESTSLAIIQYLKGVDGLFLVPIFVFKKVFEF